MFILQTLFRASRAVLLLYKISLIHIDNYCMFSFSGLIFFWIGESFWNLASKTRQ